MTYMLTIIEYTLKDIKHISFPNIYLSLFNNGNNHISYCKRRVNNSQHVGHMDHFFLQKG